MKNTHMINHTWLRSCFRLTIQYHVEMKKWAGTGNSPFSYCLFFSEGVHRYLLKNSWFQISMINAFRINNMWDTSVFCKQTQKVSPLELTYCPTAYTVYVIHCAQEYLSLRKLGKCKWISLYWNATGTSFCISSQKLACKIPLGLMQLR